MHVFCISEEGNRAEKADLWRMYRIAYHEMGALFKTLMYQGLYGDAFFYNISAPLSLEEKMAHTTAIAVNGSSEIKWKAIKSGKNNLLTIHWTHLFITTTYISFCMFSKEECNMGDYPKDEEYYVKSGKHQSKGDRHEKGCKCGCLEGLKERLKDSRGEFVGIYEKNGHAVFGKLAKVDDKVVKIVGIPYFIPYPLKFWASGECDMIQAADVYFISLCAITEFAINPFYPYPANICNGAPSPAPSSDSSTASWVTGANKPSDDSDD